MSRIPSQLKQKDDILIHPPPLSPVSSFSYPYSSTIYEKESTPSPSSSVSRISPTLLLIIVILAIIFFISGLLHLLVRFLMKRPSSLLYQSGRYIETSGSNAFQRQLQQLFRLHDRGLDQAFIDALPVFTYKDIVGLKEPFDCAVSLSEFSENDQLRLLVMCSHAFHINCIDTWLLSNSTCPLCRGTLLSSGLPLENPVQNGDDPREASNTFPSEGDHEGCSSSQKPVTVEETGSQRRVFPVRLGKFRSLNNEGTQSGEREQEGTSSSYLDARRCYSMGPCQYVVGDSNLQVALSHDNGASSEEKHAKARDQHGNCSTDHEDAEGKKISSRIRGESFSVSKIWLWPKKNKVPSSSEPHMSLPFAP